MSEATQPLQGSLKDISGIDVWAFSLDGRCLNVSRVTVFHEQNRSQLQSLRHVGQGSSPSDFLALRSRLGNPCGAAGCRAAGDTLGTPRMGWTRGSRSGFALRASSSSSPSFSANSLAPSGTPCSCIYSCSCALLGTPPSTLLLAANCSSSLAGHRTRMGASITSLAPENLEHALRSTVARHRFLLDRTSVSFRPVLKFSISPRVP